MRGRCEQEAGSRCRRRRHSARSRARAPAAVANGAAGAGRSRAAYAVGSLDEARRGFCAWRARIRRRSPSSATAARPFALGTGEEQLPSLFSLLAPPKTYQPPLPTQRPACRASLVASRPDDGRGEAAGGDALSSIAQRIEESRGVQIDQLLFRAWRGARALFLRGRRGSRVRVDTSEGHVLLLLQKGRGFVWGGRGGCKRRRAEGASPSPAGPAIPPCSRRHGADGSASSTADSDSHLRTTTLPFFFGSSWRDLEQQHACARAPRLSTPNGAPSLSRRQNMMTS
jgi:hypothetical protein